MDTIGFVENKKEIEKQKQQDDQFNGILASTGSLSRYESKTFKNILPQILACSIAGLFHVVIGIGLAYSAILLPQLEEPNSTLKITKSQGSWIASVITITIPVASMVSGFLMDTFGRLNAVRMAVIPGVLGWVLIANATSLHVMIIGRICLGFASAWGASPALVYMTEISRADIRGSLLSFAPAYYSLGFVLAYFFGWLMTWRTVAWVCIIFAVVPIVLMTLIPESPAWLVSKGKTEQARKALTWLNRYQPQPQGKTQSFAELQLNALIEEQEERQKDAIKNAGLAEKMKNFLKPTGYKPLLILVGLFVFQQFSGIYITLFYSIDFFREVGSDIDPYFASILIGAMRLVMSIINTYMLKRFNRRALIVSGSAGMAVCMFVSGLYTYWIKEGTTTLNWVPIVAILLYVVTSMIGLLSIPWTIIAELFPIEIRGVAHSIVFSSAYAIMFVSVQNYHNLKDLFSGVAGLQWFFAVVSIAGLVYAYVLMPETHMVKLNEIQDYFVYNNVYIGGIKTKNTSSAKKNINSNNSSEQRTLMNNNV